MTETEVKMLCYVVNGFGKPAIVPGARPILHLLRKGKFLPESLPVLREHVLKLRAKAAAPIEEE